MSKISNDSSISNSQFSTVQKQPAIGNKELHPINKSFTKVPQSKIDSNKKHVASTIVDEAEKAKPDTKVSFGGRSFGMSNQKINPELMKDHARQS